MTAIRRGTLRKKLRTLFEPRMYGVLMRKLARAVTGLCYVDLNDDVGASVILAGTGRSGTTWVGEVINADREYRTMFEPFLPQLCPHMHALQYMRPDEDDDGLLDDVRRVLGGKLRAGIVDKHNAKLICRKRLIKEIRANLMLKWMKRRFPQVPVVLLLRHPCAVANSRMMRNWPDELDILLDQPKLVEDHLRPFLAEIEKARTPFEKHVFMWCIQYLVPLRQLEPGDAHLAFYEVLCERPDEGVRAMFEHLGKPVTPRALAQVHKPSLVTRKESAIVAGGSLIEKWRETITSEQTARAVEILALFGLDRIYNADAMPDTEAAEEMLRGSG